LARKITTLVASIYFYGHALSSVQFAGLVISVGSMVMNFTGKGGGKGGGSGGEGHGPSAPPASDELEKMLGNDDADSGDDRPGGGGGGGVELTAAHRY
jgi:UDP-galactose transporter B1